MIVAAVTSSTWLWYFTRATGIVALVLLSAIIVLGTLGPLRASSSRWPRFAVATVHRDLSLLALVLIVLHVLTTVLDGYAPIGLIDAVVPLISSYRPIWLGLGAVAFDLMLAIVVTSLLRRSIGYRAWRWIHWLTYASWPVAVLHGLGAGSDSREAWALAVTFACVLAVAVAAVVRTVRTPAVGARLRTAAIAATVAIPIVLAAFTIIGPLAPHWSARAGTPANLIR